MSELNEVPSNLSSVSLRFEDGLIVEEVIESSTSSSSSPPQQNKNDTTSSGTNKLKQQEPAAAVNQKMANKRFSFFNNGRKSQTGKSAAVEDTNTNSSSISTKQSEVNTYDLPSPIDIVGDNDRSSLTDSNQDTNNDHNNAFGFFGSKKSVPPGSYSQDKRSLYSHPISIPELKEYFDFKESTENNNKVKDGDDKLLEKGGLVWYSNIVPDDFDSQFKSKGTLKMLPKKFYDETNQSIKPRRGNLSVRECDFFTSLIKIPSHEKSSDGKSDNNSGAGAVSKHHDGDEDDEGFADDESDFNIFDSDTKLKIFDDYSAVGDGIVGDITTQVVIRKKSKQQYSKWFFSGVINGWPGLKHLELVKIEYKYNVVPGWRTHWDSEMNPKDVAPSFPTKVLGLMEVRAKLREPGWSAQGWSKDSPGYVLYYNGSDTRQIPRVLYGTNIIREFENDRLNDAKNSGRNKGDSYQVEPSPKCVQVNMISHRHATTKEKWKDKIVYHSFALLEWDHGKYCTVIELGFLNGLGGYNARCNHTEDRDEPVTELYKCFPPEMVKPWKDTLSEIRCIDVKAKNVSEYLETMKRHTGREGYFMDVRHTFSHAVRLTFCSQDQIVQYLINYIRRGRTYSEIRKNCQTFSADFCAFLAGKKDVQPFHPLNRFEYRNQTHYFMYESSMYD